MRRPIFLIGLVMLAGMAGLGAVFANTELPEIDPLQQSTFICDASVPENCNPQNAMATVQGGEDRVNVTYEELPQDLINAVVAMEDRDFFQHRGVNPVSIARALYRDLRGEGLQQGGSTITQQFVKNAYLSPERAIIRKVKEAMLAIKLEQEMSKEEILEGYLNTIYFGRGAYGVRAASRAYFGKDVTEIGIPEAAYLAGLIRAPVLADATNHLEEAQRRRRTALVAMEEEGYITQEQVDFVDQISFEDELYYRPATQRATFETSGAMRMVGGDYITAYVDHLLKNEHGFSEQDIHGGGLRVYTSINREMQTAAWQAVNGTLDRPEDPQASLVALDDQGLVRAMVGGRGFVPEVSEANYAVRGLGSDGRPVGSTFKAVALAEAVREGKSLQSRYDAPSPKTIIQDTQGCAPEWELNNYSESDGGNLSIIDATRESSNTAYAQIMVDLGVENVLDLAHDLGMQTEFGEPCAPIVLGTDNATPMEMATVYSTFANRGMRRDPSIITRIERVDQDGNVAVLYERELSEQRVLSEQQADLVNHTLQTVINEGTGTGAAIGRPAAGKTGTSQESKDAWFVGYVPRLTAAVWMGYPDANWDDPSTPETDPQIAPMNTRGIAVHERESVTGGSLPAEIWAKFMRAVCDANGWNDPFTEVSPDVLSGGEMIGTTTTTAPPTTLPQPGGPPGGGGGRPPRTTTTPPITIEPPTSSSSSSIPDTSDTTGPTITVPRPGGGNG
jgi:penicillin-binding protein 1A